MSVIVINYKYRIRFPDDTQSIPGAKQQQYGLPTNFNISEHPPVVMRVKSHRDSDQSETQRKRRSRNRLSNRRSTGYVTPEQIEEAKNMGESGTSPQV